MKYINTHSFVIFSLLLVAVVGFFLLRNKPKLTDFVALGVIAAGLIGAWFALRPMQNAMLMDTSAEVQAMIGAGKPVLLEFQSPY